MTTLDLPVPSGGAVRVKDPYVLDVVFHDDDGGGRWSLMFRITGAEYQYYHHADDLPVSDETVELESVRAELAEALGRIVELEADLAARAAAFHERAGW